MDRMKGGKNNPMRQNLHRLFTATAALALILAATSYASADCATGLSRTRAALDGIRASCTSAACTAALSPQPTLSCPHPDLAAGVTAMMNRDPAKPVIVLLGEVHDNPHHHRLRAALIEDAANPKLAPVVEHLSVTLQPAVDDFYRSHGASERDAAAFFTAVGWAKLGWPEATIFAPLYNALLRQTAAIVAADVPKDRIRRLSRREPDALDAAERARLLLDEPFPEPLQNDLLSELEASHCGLMPKAAFTGMAAAQNYRDAHIATAAVEAAQKSGGAVVLAGNGHVRRDRGVPYYIAKFAPGIRVVSIGIIEEGDSEATPSSRYDATIVTPRAARPDPCEEMRKMRPQNPKK